MAGVTGEILDQEQIDEPQADIAGAGVRLAVVEFEVGGDHAGTPAGALEFGDHVGQRFAVGDKETAVATGGVAIACGFVQAEQGSLEPDALGGGGVLDQPDRCGEGGDQVPPRVGFGQSSRGVDERLPVAVEHVLQHEAFGSSGHSGQHRHWSFSFLGWRNI